VWSLSCDFRSRRPRLCHLPALSGGGGSVAARDQQRICAGSRHERLLMQALYRRFALAVIALACAGFSTKAFADPPFKIAVVDMQRALNETEDGRKAKGALKKLFEDRQKQLDKQQNDLKTMKESLEKQRDVLSREVLSKKLEEYQKAFGELQTTYMEFQRELGSKEGELTKDIIERMQRIMRRVGQTDGYSLVLERSESGVVFVPSNYDLTDLLIQRYNAGEGRSEAASAANTKPAATSKGK
jgi:outer membrane protein